MCESEKSIKYYTEIRSLLNAWVHYTHWYNILNNNNIKQQRQQQTIEFALWEN